MGSLYFSFLSMLKFFFSLDVMISSCLSIISRLESVLISILALISYSL